MSKHIIVRIKNNVPHKYGVLNTDPHDGENTICYWCGESTISRDRFDIVTQPDFDYIEVYRANKWEESLWNTSIYMDLGTSYKCEMAYKKLYKQEIDDRISTMADYITQKNKNVHSDDSEYYVPGNYMGGRY